MLKMSILIKYLAGMLIVSSNLIAPVHADDPASTAATGLSAQTPATLSTIILTSTLNFAQASSSSTAVPIFYGPTSCGNNGPFTLTFDDLPNLSDSANASSYRYIPNPYNQLFFSNGYGYTPQAGDTFVPISAPNLAVFLPNEVNQVNDNTDGGLGVTGEVSAGPNMNLNAYWFNVTGAYVGCNEPGPNPCQWDVVAFEQDTATNTQTVKDHYLFQTPPCEGSSCELTAITFPSTFEGLSGVQFFAYVDDSPVSFSMDNLGMGWWNNTCEAGLERLSGW